MSSKPLHGPALQVVNAEPPAPKPRGFDAFQRKHPFFGFPIAVLYKYFDDTGAYLAALLTYYGFIGIFPLLLLLSTILSFVLQHDGELQKAILKTAFAQFPGVQDQLGDPRNIGGGWKGIAIGLTGALYGGLGVAQALQYAMNTAWHIPRNSRPNPFHARAKSLGLLAVGALGVVAMTAVTVVVGTGVVPGAYARVAVAFGATLIGIVVIVTVFRMSTARKVSVRDVLPGAIFAAIGWQLTQHLGIYYVDHVINNGSATNQIFATILGLIGFIYITSVLALFGIEVNVVRAEKLYPRALLTPFTDKVLLTDGDRRAYARQARATRLKGFQQIRVEFDPSPVEQRHAADANADSDADTDTASD